MVIDAAKGIEARTRKLFEICRLRDIPIITFINKLDREAREPLELLDEIEKVLALDTAPMVWPIGKGAKFRGTYDLVQPRIRRVDEDPDGLPVSGPDDPVFATLLEDDQLGAWREEIALVNDACGRFDLKAFREGALSPVFFGSALKNFGVRDILDALVSLCAAAAGPQGSNAHRQGERAGDDRGHLQDPGEHGPQPSRPHRLHAGLLGPPDARHEGQARAHRQDHGACRPRSSSLRRTARWWRRPMPATSSAFPTAARCGSATR